jgi:hypothetical protein
LYINSSFLPGKKKKTVRLWPFFGSEGRFWFLKHCKVRTSQTPKPTISQHKPTTPKTHRTKNRTPNLKTPNTNLNPLPGPTNPQLGLSQNTHYPSQQPAQQQTQKHNTRQYTKPRTINSKNPTEPSNESKTNNESLTLVHAFT